MDRLVKDLRYSVILVPEADGAYSVSVPALPGCVSMGRSHDEAVAHVREAIIGWLETTTEMGQSIPVETPALLVAGVAEAIAIIDELRESGDMPAGDGYEFSIVPVDVPLPVPV